MLSKYELGYKYCSQCGKFIMTPFTRCPYCNTPLRTRSHKIRRIMKENRSIDPNKYLNDR